MITVEYGGRFGNILVQCAAGYVLAKKLGWSFKPVTVAETNHKGNPYVVDTTKMINVSELTSSSERVFDNTIVLADDFKMGRRLKKEEGAQDYFEYLDKEPSSNYLVRGFYQDSRLLCDYREDVIELYGNNNLEPKPDPDDMFIHARFGDTLDLVRTYCDAQYIQRQLESDRKKYRNIYLSTDSIDYDPICDLIKKYDLIPYRNNPVDTVLFGKNFNNLILSAGSFSYWIGYLSSAKNISVYGYGQPGMQQPKMKVRVVCALQLNDAWSYNKNVRFSL